MKLANWLNNIGDDSLGFILNMAERDDILSLAGGIPDPALFPIDHFSEELERVYKNNPGLLNSYSNPFGYQPLREWILNSTLTVNNLSVENICITNGAQQAIDIISKIMINSGDIVLTEDPSYLGALKVFKSYNAKIIGVPVDNEGMLTQELERKIIKFNPSFIYIVPNGQNPTGVTTSFERRKKIVEICERNNVLIIEDDPYRYLQYNVNSLPTLHELSKKPNVIYLGSFSKILSPGLRIGWAILPDFMQGAFQIAKQNTDLMTNNIIQKALYNFLQVFSLEDYLIRTNQIYIDKMDALTHELSSCKINYEYTVPTHGLFLWTKVPNDINIMGLTNQCLKENVCLVPGPYFFITEDNQPYLRLNFSVPSKEEITEAIKRMNNIIENKLTLRVR